MWSSKIQGGHDHKVDIYAIGIMLREAAQFNLPEGT
jgi:hypothetical protein